MSSEKEIVNNWYNKKGFFTINNIKTSTNKDAGILALKFEKGTVEEVLHIGVSCSITNNIAETTKLDKSIKDMVKSKFEDKSIKEAISSNIKQFNIEKNRLRKLIVIGAVPKSRKKEIIKEFNQKDVEVLELEDILFEVMDNLDTRYYRNDIIRTLQLLKFLLLGQPEKMSKLVSSLSNTSRKELIVSMLDKDEIVKEFKMTNKERLGAILKSSKIKPADLVDILDRTVLNKRTRKDFFENLMKNDKMRTLLREAMDVGVVLPKKEVPLDKFFD